MVRAETRQSGREALTYAETFFHFGVEKSSAGAVGLDPFSVDDKLGDGAFADVAQQLFDGRGD